MIGLRLQSFLLSIDFPRYTTGKPQNKNYNYLMLRILCTLRNFCGGIPIIFLKTAEK